MELNENIIRELVKEELGIAMEVYDATQNVYQNILNDIKTRDSEITEVCYIKEGSVNSILFNTNIKVNYVYRNFLDKDIITNFDIEFLTEGGTVFFNKKHIWINVNLIVINGAINKQEAVNTIQHELEHVYQQIRGNKQIPYNDMRYAKMKTDLEGNNENRKKVSRLVYLAYKSEQEGFINGTYAWCMTNDAITPPYDYKNIKNSPAGKVYNEMLQLYNEIFNNNEMTNIITKEYNLSKNKVIKSMKNFQNRLGKVIVKVNNDKAKIWRM